MVYDVWSKQEFSANKQMVQMVFFVLGKTSNVQVITAGRQLHSCSDAQSCLFLEYVNYWVNYALLQFNDMPPKLNYSILFLCQWYGNTFNVHNIRWPYADKVNHHLQNILIWMIQHKLQTHPNNQNMQIGSWYNVKNKKTRKPLLINNRLIPETASHLSV